MSCTQITLAGKQCSRVARYPPDNKSFCGQHYNKIAKKERVSNGTDLFEPDNSEAKDAPINQAPDSVGEDKLYSETMGANLFGNMDGAGNFYITKSVITTSQQRSKRLPKEIKFIKSNLPLHFNSTIAIRFNTDRPYLCTAIIFAPNNTPYDSGCFQYDIYLPPTYPSTPPKVQLITTGNSKVRFSPNLYANGKVCLSLLGTWRGLNQSQEWNQKTSNLWQVLVSIQSAIMGSEYPYFDEPGAEREIGTVKGDTQRRVGVNGGYERLREATIKHAIIEQIEKPVKGFEQLILDHFRIKKNYIMSVCMTWIDQAEISDTPGHYDRLMMLTNKLEKTFAKI